MKRLVVTQIEQFAHADFVGRKVVSRNVQCQIISFVLRIASFGFEQLLLEYARNLDTLSNRGFSDRLLSLSILKTANEAETQSLLEQLKKDASDDAVKIGALIGWMNSQEMSAEAVAWMKTLPRTLWQNERLRSIWRRPSWRPATGRDCANFAWERSGMLAAKDPINAEKALRMLYDFYASRRDTQKLYRMLVHLEKVRPTDRSVRNNLPQITASKLEFEPGVSRGAGGL
jgi:hypothetical protein